MNNYPEFVEIKGKRYKINTDFRCAIKCNEIAMDDNIDDEERALAIIYTLYGDEGLNDCENHFKLLELAEKYLSCGQDDKSINDIIDMDYVEDMPYIEASFISDLKIDLENTKMHWWKFYYLLGALSNSELGNCCIFNRIRQLRTFDINKISDKNEREEILKAKERYALKRYKKKPTEKQKESAEKFFEQLGL